MSFVYNLRHLSFLLGTARRLQLSCTVAVTDVEEIFHKVWARVSLAAGAKGGGDARGIGHCWAVE